MVRTQIYLTEEERTGLMALAESTGKKQSELIREAVDCYIARFDESRRSAALNSAAGMWKDRQDLPDLEALRKSWDRG